VRAANGKTPLAIKKNVNGRDGTVEVEILNEAQKRRDDVLVGLSGKCRNLTRRILHVQVGRRRTIPCVRAPRSITDDDARRLESTARRGLTDAGWSWRAHLARRPRWQIIRIFDSTAVDVEARNYRLYRRSNEVGLRGVAFFLRDFLPVKLANAREHVDDEFAIVLGFCAQIFVQPEGMQVLQAAKSMHLLQINDLRGKHDAINRPGSWERTISKHQCTLSSSPHFS